MKTETAIAKAVRGQFADQFVSVKRSTFTYLHHDKKSFEDRSIPAFRVEVSPKHVRSAVDSWDVVSFLRAAGYFATLRTDGIWVADMNKSELPVNNAFPIQWEAA